MICDGRVDNPNAKIEDGLVQCCQPQEDDDSLERALTWLGNNFSVRRNPGRRGAGSTWHYYYLYGLERVGRLTARRLIGEHDWYREGAAELIKLQDGVLGSIKPRMTTSLGNEYTETAFALL